MAIFGFFQASRVSLEIKLIPSNSCLIIKKYKELASNVKSGISSKQPQNHFEIHPIQ